MPNKIDIVDNNNQPTGQQSAINDALLQSQWHRGVHIIVYTKTGYVLVQKRSATVVMHPGFLDISCGGFVDAGESPEHAAVRELGEELGLRVAATDLEFMGIHRKSHAWPRQRKHSRVFLYCYAVCLPDHHADVSHLQADEVQWAGFISNRSAKRLLRLHHLKGLGRIEPLYGFYRSLLNAVAKQS